MFKTSRFCGFHESYYDHPCSIVSEQDVLDMEIKGNGLIATCRRKWYDLFLLSYSNEMAGDYYHSTHAMNQDRKYHFYKYRHCIHPLSKFRLYWDIFMLHAMILYKIHVFCMTSLIAISMPISVHVLAMLFEVCMILDIFLNARTGFIDNVNRKVVLEKDQVVLHFCSTKLFFHVASAIPLVFITFLRYGSEIDCTICKANYFMCTINFFTIISSFRIYDRSSYWKGNAVSSKHVVFYRFLRIGIIVVGIVIQLFHYSDTISVITLFNEPYNKTNRFLPNSFFHMMFLSKYVRKMNLTDSYYMNAQFWRIVNFMTILDEDLKFSTTYPHPFMKLLNCMMIMFCLFWLWVELYTYMSSETYIDRQVSVEKDYLMNILKTRQLSEDYCVKMKRYFQYPAAKLRLIEKKNGLYKNLPSVLKDDISFHCRLNLIKIPYFSDWPKEILEKLIALVKEDIYLENDMIAEAGAEGEGLLMVNAGVLAVYTSQNKEVGHLIDGDYFGQLSLVTDREVLTSSVVAASLCTVLLLDKFQFRMVMRDYPRLFYSLKEALKEEYQK